MDESRRRLRDADQSLLRAYQWMALRAPALLEFRDPRATNESQLLRRLKALAELSFFAAFVARNQSLPRVVAPLLCAWIRSRAFWNLAKKSPDHCSLFLPTLAAARRLGVLDDAEESASIDYAWRSYRGTKERIPFRQIDLLHAAHCLTGDQGFMVEAIDAANRGCLRRGANVALVSTSDDYAITHTIFYLTDFGRLPWPTSLVPRPDLLRILDGLSVVAAEEANLDLVGEYVMAKAHLRAGRDGVFDEQALILDRQRSDGSWGGPADMSSALVTDGFPDSERETWSDYHTTLVCIAGLEAEGLLGAESEDAAAVACFSSQPCRPTAPERNSRDAWYGRLGTPAELAACIEELLGAPHVLEEDPELAAVLRSVALELCEHVGSNEHARRIEAGIVACLAGHSPDDPLQERCSILARDSLLDLAYGRTLTASPSELVRMWRIAYYVLVAEQRQGSGNGVAERSRRLRQWFDALVLRGEDVAVQELSATMTRVRVDGIRSAPEILATT